MAAKCMSRSSLANLRICGSGALRCLERTGNFQGSVKKSHCFHSTALLLKARTRSQWRKDRAPALTKLMPDKPEETEPRKAYGGHKKIKAMQVNRGIYAWNSLDIEFECPILSVVHNTAHRDFNQKGVMVKGTIVEVDSSPFKTWYSSYYKKEDSSQEANSSLENLMPYLDKGKLYAKITTRPGQIGFCNGYILEREELETLFNTREDLRPKSPQGQ